MSKSKKVSVPAEPTVSWHALGVEEAFKRLSSSEEGLTAEEARHRLDAHGPNVIERVSKDGPLKLLLRQINNPLIWVLVASSIVAVLLGKVTDGSVVMAVVVLNTIIGFIQEYRAGRAIEALAAMVPESATVLRSGRRVMLPVAELVPGDVVLLASGDKIPADMRVVQHKNLQVQEAALTGEALPVEKQVSALPEQTVLGDRRSMVYSGTLVTSGTGLALVAETGARTELGRISTLLNEAADLETPLTRALGSIAKWLTIAIMVVSAILLAAGAVRLIGAGTPLVVALKDTLMFAIALAVAAIPEGLPAVVTIALAIGVQRMAARHAIIRELPAVETLGSTTVICTDKTGTLTKNEMTVQEIWTLSGVYTVTGVGYEPRGEFQRDGKAIAPPKDALDLLAAAALCSDASLHHSGGAWEITGDPTEAALIVAAEKGGFRVEELRAQSPRLDVIPFESEQQFMATLVRRGDVTEVIMKGAPEAVAQRCAGIDAAAHARLVDEVHRMASQGMRVLAIAHKPWTKDAPHLQMTDTAADFTLQGLCGMIDPPRPEAIEAIRACKAAGVVVKMITGDHRATAQAIGEQLGLGSELPALSGHELAAMDDAALREAVPHRHVFARVAPEHKLALVRALQDNNEVVAMTGDGVNDAPALKQSNIGIAMGITGTSVAKESADIVLTDDNFASIAAAVEEGRRVYDNLIKSLAFLLPTNLGLAFILMWALMFFPFDPATLKLLLPMEPTQLLWINLVAAVALALPLAFEAKEPDVMRRPPRRVNAPVLSGFVVVRTVYAAILMTAGALCLFNLEYNAALERGVEAAKALAEAQTMAVTTVIMFQIFYLLNCRSMRDSVLSIGFFSNPAVFIGIGAVLVLHALFIYLPYMEHVFRSAPLAPIDLLKSVAAGAIILPVISVEKWLRSLLKARRCAAS